MTGLSIIICTLNPDLDVWRLVIEHLKAAVHEGVDYELLVIDNGSAISLDRVDACYPSSTRFIHESRAGVFYARQKGAESASYDWVLYVDDDNLLASDYISKAIEFIKSYPEVGVFGGRIELTDALAHRVSWQRPVLDLLAIRDFGLQSFIYFDEGVLQPMDPPTAGMFVRTAHLRSFFDDYAGQGEELGRGPDGLSGGEDSLLVHYVLRSGHPAGYCGALRLEHALSPCRLRFWSLFHLSMSMGESHAKLHRILGLPVKQIALLGVFLKFSYHVIKYSSLGVRASFVRSAWKFGYNRQISADA